MRKKILSLMLSLVMVITMIPMMGSVAFADVELPSLTNVKIENDILTLDPFEGADRYSVTAATWGVLLQANLVTSKVCLKSLALSQAYIVCG